MAQRPRPDSESFPAESGASHPSQRQASADTRMIGLVARSHAAQAPRSNRPSDHEAVCFGHLGRARLFSTLHCAFHDGGPPNGRSFNISPAPTSGAGPETAGFVGLPAETLDGTRLPQRPWPFCTASWSLGREGVHRASIPAWANPHSGLTVERATLDGLCVDTAATGLSRVESARLLAVRLSPDTLA
jgi:hypothetical protein